MAFLPALAIPVLQALGLGGLSALGAHAVKKVIGDAVPDETAAEMLSLSIQGQMDHPALQSLGPSRLSELAELKTAMGASPNLFFRQDALNPQSGTGFLNQPMVSSHSAQVDHSARTQTLSDAAALSQLRGVQSQLLSLDPVQMSRDPGMAANTLGPSGGSLWQGSSTSMNHQDPRFLSLQSSTQSPTQYALPSAGTAQGVPTTIPALQQGLMTSSKLSIHPNSGLIIAPQPTNKLQDNQATLVSRPSSLGTQNPIAQGIAGAEGSSGLANTVRGVGSEVYSAVREAGNAAAAGALAQIGGVATNVAKQGLSKAGGFLGNLISNGLTSIAKKIIGDAPPGGGFENFSATRGGYIPPTLDSVLPSNLMTVGPYSQNVLARNVDVNKIVGDAPPGEEGGEVMTPAQTDAAVNNLKNSVIFNIMSRVVLNEQILVQSTSLPRGMSESQLNNFYARDLESLVGTYKQSEVNAVFGMKGMTLQYDIMVAGVYVAGEKDKAAVTDASGKVVTPAVYTGKNAITAYETGYFFCTGCALETSRVAPPVTGNTTLNQLSPLLAGAALGEYSSQLRIKTFSTDIDLMVRASAITINNLQAQQGYSFCLPLTKIMGYLLSHVQLLGSEINDIVGDLYFAPGNRGGYVTYSRAFPLEALETPDAWNDYSWAGAEFSVISESDFIKATVGIVSTSNWGVFAPEMWGHQCALVFVPSNDKHNQMMNAVRMVAQLAYPAQLSALTGNFQYFSREGGLVRITDKVKAPKKAMLTRIPGPYKYVLFVVIGAREVSSTGITVGDGSGTAGHFIELNGHDHAPATPYTAPDGDSAMGYARFGACSNTAQPMWMSYIKEWEIAFGNSSDRSSAMRFWADNSVLFANYFLATNPIDVGDAQTFAFLSWCDPNSHGTIASPYQQFTDLPVAWLNRAKGIGKISWIGAMNSAKTATYMPVAGIAPNAEQQEAWKWLTDAPDGCRLPYEDPMISFMVMKKWISPNEEYPAVSIDDAARFGHTITVMANQMAAVCDMTVQQRDFLLTEVVYPPLLLQIIPMGLMRQKNVLWPAFEEVLANGIQYPQYWCNRDVNMHCWHDINYWKVTADDLYSEHIINASLISTMARIPVSIAGQWFAPLYPQYIQLKLNDHFMRPQRNYINWKRVARAMFVAEYAEETTQLLGKLLAPISWLLWRLPLGVIISDGQGVNNGWLVQTTNYQNIHEYYVHMEQPDASRNQVMTREFGAGNVTVPPTTKISLPVGEFIIKRSLAGGLQPFHLMMQGPRDAFIGVGSGSTAYQMFVQTNTPQAIFVSETWATIPDWLFSPAGLQSVRDTI